MALRKCKDCGNIVSKVAKACPTCGAPVKGKGIISTLFRWLIIIFVIIPVGASIFIGVYSSITSNSNEEKTETKKPSKYQLKVKAIEDMELSNLKWSLVGFDNVAEVSFELTNSTGSVVKDINVTCYYFSNSNTQLSKNNHTIYEVLEKGQSLKISKLNMGIVNNQSSKVSCSVTHLDLL